HGARHLLLSSRRGPDAPGAKELCAELEALGATATVSKCDVSDKDQLEALIAKIPKEHPLGSVIHTAAVLDDGVITSLDQKRLDYVLAPKLDAAQHLHDLTKDMALDEFILFSSGAGVMGAPGQASYAAANSYLDALAQYRVAEGLAGHSIAWGLWQNTSDLTGDLSE